MVALSTAFYARLSIGSRQIVEIFNILNEFMGNIFGEVPAYTTIGYWAQELGLSVYKESCTLFKGKRYALIVDESMMIGSEKCYSWHRFRSQGLRHRLSASASDDRRRQNRIRGNLSGVCPSARNAG
jgi:hypothetical protein